VNNKQEILEILENVDTNMADTPTYTTDAPLWGAVKDLRHAIGRLVEALVEVPPPAPAERFMDLEALNKDLAARLREANDRVEVLKQLHDNCERREALACERNIKLADELDQMRRRIEGLYMDSIGMYEVKQKKVDGPEKQA
jgi:hypothetical protein